MVRGSHKVVIAGMVWFTPDTFSRCLAIFDDPDQYPRSYNEWLADAERTEQSLHSRGIQVLRVEMDPDTFPAWCAAKGLNKIDAYARSHYANLKAAESMGLG